MSLALQLERALGVTHGMSDIEGPISRPGHRLKMSIYDDVTGEVVGKVVIKRVELDDLDDWSPPDGAGVQRGQSGKDHWGGSCKYQAVALRKKVFGRRSNISVWVVYLSGLDKK